MNSPRLIFPAAALVAFLGTSPSLQAAGESTLRYPAPADADLYTVCWTGSQFVAAGQGGVIFTSPDAVTWTFRHCGVLSVWRASAAGGGKIVLGADSGVVITSSDGIAWTSPTLPKTGPFSSLNFNIVRDLAWNGTVFMITSSTGSDSWSSPDGISWTFIGPDLNNFFRGLAVKGNQFASLDAGARLWTSTGGEWTSVQTNSEIMEHLVWTGERYIGVKNGGAATSVDGITWTPRSTGSSMEPKHLVWTGSQAVAVGSGGAIITSPNGATWTPQVSGTASNLHSVTWSGSKLVAVGDDGIILTSDTGSTWQIQKAGTPPPVSPGHVGWTGTSALAVGPGGTLYSSDGDAWVKTAAPSTPAVSNYFTAKPQSRFRLASHGGRVVAAISDFGHSSTGIWITDPMGTSWTQAPSARNSSSGLAVVWTGTEFVALTQRRVNISGDWNYEIKMNRSPDGLVWTVDNTYLPFSVDLVWTGQSVVNQGGEWLVWTGTTVVAVAEGGTIKTSPDGSVWSAPHSSLVGDGVVQEVVWTGSRLLAVTPFSVHEAAPAGPWQLVSRRGGSSITWTGTQALVATGSEIFSIEGIGLSAWSTWLAAHFTPAQLSDPNVTGPLADPDHDGQASLVEFATGTNPASTSDAPLITVVHSPQGLRFRWPLNTGASTGTVTPQISFDLDAWDTLTATPISGTAGGIRIMESAPLTTQQTAFVRLKVQLLE